MHKKSLLSVIILVALLVAMATDVFGAEKDLALKSIMSEADSFKEIEEPFLYYEAYKGDSLIGYCCYTTDAAPDEKAYGGPMQILVGLDRDGRIKDLKVLHHSESPAYADGITGPGFLDQFKGKNAKDAFIVGEDIDAITHATVSSRALATILKASLDNLDRVISEAKEEKTNSAALNLDTDFYITLSIIIFLMVAFYLKKALLRYAGLAVSIAYFGFLKANFISMSNLGSIFLWRLPDPRWNLAWYVFIFSGMGLTFLLARFYCTYMCPFGGLQIFLNKIFKLNIQITPELARRLKKIRLFLLCACIALILILRNPNVVNYEPFSTVFLIRGSIIAWSIAIIILALSLFHHRPFCNYFCAAGEFLDILSNLGKGIFRRR